MELLRDPIRLAFAFVGPVILMFAMGYGITFDVENLKYAAFDQDQTPESRRLLESFSGSHYFSERPPISSTAELEQRMRSGELAVAVEIPSGFGRDLASLHSPEAAFWIDGAMPFRGETAKGYVTGLLLRLCAGPRDGALRPQCTYPMSILGSVNIENRFRYNQAFKSVFSMVPSVIVIMLVLIPAIMATIGVVREVETGSIANFRSTPISKFEFLLGKQLPYVVVGMLAFILMVLMASVVFHVPVKGSFGALALGALLYVFSTCGFGQLVSTFTKTQVAAVFATTVLCPHPRCEFFRPARARVLPYRRREGYWPAVSSGLVSADQRRHLHQRPELFRSRVQCARACGVLGRLLHCRSYIPAETGEAEMSERARPPIHENWRQRSRQRRRSGPGSNRFAKLRLHLANIYRLMIKELRSFRSDPIMLALVAYSFTIAIYAAATGASTEATNLSVGIVDEDHSDLSRRIADGLTPPTFKPVDTAQGDGNRPDDEFATGPLRHRDSRQNSRRIFSPGGSPRFKSMSMPPRRPRPSMA